MPPRSPHPQQPSPPPTLPMPAPPLRLHFVPGFLSPKLLCPLPPTAYSPLFPQALLQAPSSRAPPPNPGGFQPPCMHMGDARPPLACKYGSSTSWELPSGPDTSFSASISSSKATAMIVSAPKNAHALSQRYFDMGIDTRMQQ